MAPLSGRYSIGFGQDAVLDTGVTMVAGMQPLKLTNDELKEELFQEIRIVGNMTLVAPMLEVFSD